MENSELENRKLEVEVEKLLLERKKLQKDIETYDDRFEIEKKKIYSDRNRFWAETFRLVVIALITSGITYMVNNSIEERKKNNELIIDDYKSFKEDRKGFKDSTLSFIAKKSLACNMWEDYKDLNISNVQKFLQKLAGSCDDSALQRDQAIISNEIPKFKADTALKKVFAAAEKKNNEIQEKLITAKGIEKNILINEKKKTDHLIDSLSSLPKVSALSAASEAVTKEVNNQTKIINDVVKEISTDKLEDGYPQTKWFKKGYFSIIDNMKIVLDDILNNQGIIVSMCNSINSYDCADSLKIDLSDYENKISLDRPIKVLSNGYKYIIRLDHIGNAGKNPFTKAAYITIEKYKNRI